MTVVASLVVDAGDFELGQALAGTTTRIELTEFVPVNNDFVPYFWKERDGDTEAFERTARDHPAVADLVDLDGRVGAHLYQIEWADGVDVFLGALGEQNIMVEKAFTEQGEEWLFRLRAVDQEALSAFQRTCHENDVRLDVRRVAHNPTGETQSWPLVGITAKQKAALVLALERGYFDVPREVSATELGEELEISRQSFSRRLQRAQQTVFTNLFAELDA